MESQGFDDYRNRYPHIAMERRGGILQVRFHSDGKSLVWGFETKTECAYMFSDIGNDAENLVIILTGTGESFISQGFTNVGSAATTGATVHPERFARKNLPEGKKLLMNLLDIQVPMIAAVNGPATVHAELALLCDIVLAAEDTVFQDSLHFQRGLVPGDGAHVIWPALLGINRARYFLLTGQRISADEALRLGLVNEVLPKPQLLERAWHLAESIVKQPPTTLRLFREAVLQPYRRLMLENLGSGLALTGLGAAGYWPFGDPDLKK